MLFCPTGITSAGRIHLYLAFLFHRDYFSRPDSSLPCSFAPQGLFRPTRCISISLFCSTRIISADQMHLYLALLFHRDAFHRPDASLSSSFVPQGLFCPSRMHLYLPLLLHRDYFSSTSNLRSQPDTHFAADMFPYKKPSLFRCRASNPNFRKNPESMFFNLSYATLDALRKQSFLRLSAAFAAYSPSHNGAFVSKLPQHLMLGLCVAHC